MNRYTFEKIVKRMGDAFGTIKHGQEDQYDAIFFTLESNALKVNRRNPKANSRSFREALLMALHTVNMHLTGREEDLTPFQTPENKELLHALLYAFDPFVNPELDSIVKKDAATYAGVDEIDDYPTDYLRKYYAVPVKCMIRLIESVDIWEKLLGSNGYFKSIEDTVGSAVDRNDSELHTTTFLLNKPVTEAQDQA